MVDYIYDHLDDDILNSELLRIISIVREQYFEVLNNKKKQQITTIKQIQFEGNELKGIFGYLRNQDGGEFKSDTLKLSGGGSINESSPLSNLLKYDSRHINEYFVNYKERDAKEGESWIEFDFCKQKVELKSYTIRSDDWGPDSHHPMSWRFVGSNDHENWVEIDKRKNSSELKGNYKQSRFICNCNNNNFYRFIRYIQDDNWCLNSRRYHNIDLTCIEFFGSISSSNQ